MENGIRRAWKGKRIWNRLKKKYNIDYNKVAVVLIDTDEEWNQYALLHLECYQRRKNAEKALVFYLDEIPEGLVESYAPADALLVPMKKVQLVLLADYYCLYRFFYNIVFITMNVLRDNYSEAIMNQGNITKEELICLGFYCLRCVPALQEKEGCNVQKRIKKDRE